MAFGVLFFLAGFLSEFTGLAEFYLLRDLGLDVAECYIAGNAIDAVWSLRPWLGNLSDALGKRHAQLGVVFALASAVCVLVWRAPGPWWVVVALLCGVELAAAAGITIADALVVPLAKTQPAAVPGHQRRRILGGMAASWCSAWILTVPEDLRPQRTRDVFAFQGLAFLFSSLYAASFVREERGEEPPPEAPPSSSSFERGVVDAALGDRVVRAILVFSLISAALPSSGTAVAYFLAGPLGLEPATFAAMDFLRGCCYVLGTFFDPGVPFERVLLAHAATGFLLGVPTVVLVGRTAHAVLDDRFVLFSSCALASFSAVVHGTTAAVHAARISPAGREGGTYNGVVSLPTLAQPVGILGTYLLTKWFDIDHDRFYYLPSFVALTNAFSAVPLLYAASLPSRR